MRRFFAPLLVCITIPCLAPAAPPRQNHVYEAGHCGVSFDKREGTWCESYWARDRAGKWQLLLTAPDSAKVRHLPSTLGGFSAGRTSFYPGVPALPLDAATVSDNERTFTMSGTVNDCDVTRTIELRDACVHVSLELAPRAPGGRYEYLLASHAFLPGEAALSSYKRLDLAYAPGLRPRQWQVIGDHMFRAPAAVAQRGRLMAAIVPDLDSLAVNRSAPAIVDLDCQNGLVDAPLLSYGFCSHRVDGHVYFTHDPNQKLHVPPRLVLAYDILLDADAPNPHALPEDAATSGSIAAVRGGRSGFHAVVRHLWTRYGERHFRGALPQCVPFAEYARTSYPAAFNERLQGRTAWWENTVEGRPVGGVYAGWDRDKGFVHWQAWFNNLFGAYGAHWWGTKLGNAQWTDKAGRMLNMALAAPQDRGAFPSRWNNLDRRWEGAMIAPRIPGGKAWYDSTDMAWKCIWLLRFHEDFEKKQEILDYCTKLADFFIDKQEPGGAIPSWFTRELAPVDVLRESAQTALPAWFLAEVYAITRQEKYKTAACKAGDFLLREVVAHGRYYDFEVFFSCSPKACVDGGRNHDAMLDWHTQQPPQNTLCMQWTAEALRRLFELTGNDGYLAGGVLALDNMAIYQNVWPIPWRRAANTFGGFGAQNSDGEYNDARQAQFACTLCDYGALLGRRDYFERGVAALRASLALVNHPAHIANGVCPEPSCPPGLAPENVGHGGDDRHGVRTGFDWGEGSALAGVAYVMNRYGGAYIDAKKKLAVGIDGVAVEAGDGNAILVTDLLKSLRSPYAPPCAVTPVVAGAAIDTFTFNWQRIKAGQPIEPAEPAAPTTATKPMENPSWDFEDGTLQGWTNTGNFPEAPTNSKREDFNKTGAWFIGSCENSFGGHNDTLTGCFYSPEFVVTKDRIRLKVGGGDVPGAKVSLIRATDYRELRMARGANTEHMREVEWDMRTYRGEPVFIRVTDYETGEWGHINIDDVRCE